MVLYVLGVTIANNAGKATPLIGRGHQLGKNKIKIFVKQRSRIVVIVTKSLFLFGD